MAQITLTLETSSDATRVPNEPAVAALKNGTWIVGTGLLINDDGDFLTAAHVALAIEDASKRLSTLGIPTHVGVAFAAANVDGPLQVRSDVLTLGAAIQSIDFKHDLAIIRTGANPEGIGTRVNGKNTLEPPKPVRFTAEKPRVGEEVFACGFPVGSNDLVTTAGTIASTEGFETLLTASAHGLSDRVDVYKVDLRISPGNSGGPLFRRSDQAVVGILVEAVNGGGYAIAVPSAEVTDALTNGGFKWQPAAEQQKTDKHRPHSAAHKPAHP